MVEQLALSSAFLIDFLTVLGIGALVGLERERRRDQKLIVAGVRTFPLYATSGYMIGVLGQLTNTPFVLPAGVLLIGAAALAFFFVRHQLGLTGFTTPMAMVVTFLAGAFVAYDLRTPAIVIGVATTFLLLTKERLHHFAEYLDEEEMMSALQFFAILFILFPLVSGTRGPLGGISWLGRGRLVDPYVILVVVIFVSLISFAAFLAMRIVGPQRGLPASGLLGGLVSSEATTASLAQLAKRNHSLVLAAVAGTLLSTLTMFGRNVAIAAFANPEVALVRGLLIVLLPVTLANALLAYRALRNVGPVEETIDVRSPFAVGPAIRFAALFALLSVVTAFSSDLFGIAGVYATALGGLVSAGAVVATVATLHAQNQITLTVAVTTAALASVIGAANKLVLLRYMSPRVFRRARVSFVALTLVGAVSIVTYAFWGV